MRMSLMLALFIEVTFASPIILSEIMANPETVMDSHGEFLELANWSLDSIRIDSLTLNIDGTHYRLHDLFFLPHSQFLICRDSLASENGGLNCNQNFSNLSLTNSRALSISLQVNDEAAVVYSIPAARTGVSWENNFDSQKNFQSFSPSNHFWRGKDSATPGMRNSQSVEVAQSDLGILSVILDSVGNLRVAVENFGTSKAPPSFLSLRLDEDWDGVAETFLDSIPVEMENMNQKNFSVHVNNQIRGLVYAGLSYDENTRNNHFVVAYETQKPLRITEWCPAPESGGAEWVEVRNATSDSGGVGRIIYLSHVQLNGILIATKKERLEPGEYLVVTQSLLNFQNQFGSIKVRAWELSSWPTLRNSGDTLKLSMQGNILDQVEFGMEAAIAKGQCFTKNYENKVVSTKNVLTSPGFIGSETNEFSWTFSGRKVSLENPLQIRVQAPADFNYSLSVFDLEGNKIMTIGSGSQGKSEFTWNGIGANGNKLSRGPYLIGLNAIGHATRKQVVVVP